MPYAVSLNGTDGKLKDPMPNMTSWQPAVASNLEGRPELVKGEVADGFQRAGAEADASNRQNKRNLARLF